jgi:tetratricopeptide (TPR) repeat protein
METPVTAVDFHRRGMAYYARKQYEQAVEDLKQAITLDSSFTDAYYSLGMVYKAMGKTEDACAAFQQVIDIIANEDSAGKVSLDMLRKLALGHINEMRQGDWNLEKEIWKHEN